MESPATGRRLLATLGLGLLAALVGWPRVSSLENGLARTPPMGWIGWQRFACEIDCERHPDTCINERLFVEQAAQLVTRGLRDLGYHYVNIDDCWSEMERNPVSQQLVANRTRFPNSMAALSSKVHDLGLKLGLYGDCGTKTCAGYPAQLKPRHEGSLEPHPAAWRSSGEGDYFRLDAETLESWQVDSFKLDGCFIDPFKSEATCPRFSQALLGLQRPVLLTCEWPFYLGLYGHAHVNWSLAADSCNLWRYFDDIDDSWQGVLNTIDYTVKHQSSILQYHGPGHWFDPDQLLVGDFGLSREQSFAQMALWSVWSAPLFMSNDLRLLDRWQLDILKNKHLIGVNQDPLGVLGLLVAEQRQVERHIQVFVKPVLGPSAGRSGCPSFVVLYLNRGVLGPRAQVSFPLADLLLAAPLELAARRELQLLASRPGAEPEEPPPTRGLIDPPRCLQSLATTSGGGGQRLEAEQPADPATPTRFRVTDLRDGAELAPSMGPADLVRLDVAPSGARVLRLDPLGARGAN